MLESAGRAGLQMGLGISVRWALVGKQTRRSVEGGPLVSLPLMLFMSYSLLFLLLLLLLLLPFSCSLFLCQMGFVSDLVLAVSELCFFFGDF